MDKIAAILPIMGIRCSVLFRYDNRCREEATTGIVRELDGSNYRLTAYCPDHWQAHKRGHPEGVAETSETEGGTAG